jgi:hypothetical protein
VFPSDEAEEFAAGAVLRVTVKIKARFDLRLATADAALAGEVLRRARKSNLRPSGGTCSRIGGGRI